MHALTILPTATNPLTTYYPKFYFILEMPGPGPVVILPPLATWAQQRITAILQSTTSEALEAALSNFLTRNANITVNGVHLSRDQWIKQLRNTEALEESASVSYNGSVEVPANKSEPTKVNISCPTSQQV